MSSQPVTHQPDPYAEFGGSTTPAPPGLIEAGNINLYDRPSIPNPNGGNSTVFSTSFNEDGKEILIPRAADGKILSTQDAIDRYHRTGEHLGKFKDVPSADAYAEQLHNDYAAGKYSNHANQVKQSGFTNENAGYNIGTLGRGVGSTTPAPTATPSPNTGSDPYAEFGGSVTPPTTGTSTTPHVGPTGQSNPNNIYRATDEESTPEGAAAAIARREAQHPILSGIGQGAESLLQPGFHPIDMVEGIVKQSLPTFQVYDSVKKAYPLLQTYEKARSQGQSVWQSIAATNDFAKKQDAAHQAVEQAIADYKKNPTQTTAKVLTQVAGTVAMLAAGGTGATAEADVPLVTRAAETAPTEAEVAASTPKPGIVNTVKNVAKQVVQGKKVAQPGAQSAVREGVQSSVETTNAAAAKEPLAPTPTDKFPVSVEHDADGQVINADGRHRVVEAWERGDQTIPVVTKLADGATEIINQPPQAVAAKMGLGDTVEEAKDALANTDANQPYRAGNGKPRTPVYETPTPKTSSDVTPVKTVKLPEATEPLTENSKTTIVDDHLDALEQQKSSAYKRMDDTAGFDVKALKDKLKTDKYNLKQLGSSDPDKTGRLVEAINDSTDRIAEANEKMKAAGIDPDYADALNKRWEAGQDYKASLLKRTNPDGSMNVKGLWDDAKKMRNDPEYGDRLEQWFGSKDAADAYVKALEKAHAAGLQAMKRQAFVRQILWRVAGTTAAGAVGLGLYDATH